MAGIAHYSRFLIWSEEAEHAFLRSLGLSVITQLPDGQGAISWPRVSVGCDYSKPARFEDVLDIEVRVEKRGTKSVTYAFRFVRAGDGEELARARTTAVCCRFRRGDREGDGHRIESIPIPAAFDALRPSANPSPTQAPDPEPA